MKTDRVLSFIFKSEYKQFSGVATAQHGHLFILLSIETSAHTVSPSLFFSQAVNIYWDNLDFASSNNFRTSIISASE